MKIRITCCWCIPYWFGYFSSDNFLFVFFFVLDSWLFDLNSQLYLCSWFTINKIASLCQIFYWIYPTDNTLVISGKIYHCMWNVHCHLNVCSVSVSLHMSAVQVSLAQFISSTLQTYGPNVIQGFPTIERIKKTAIYSACSDKLLLCVDQFRSRIFESFFTFNEFVTIHNITSERTIILSN